MDREREGKRERERERSCICNSHVSGKLSANQLRAFSLHFMQRLPLPACWVKVKLRQRKLAEAPSEKGRGKFAGGSCLETVAAFLKDLRWISENLFFSSAKRKISRAPFCKHRNSLFSWQTLLASRINEILTLVEFNKLWY